MPDQFDQPDTESDDLIAILTDSDKPLNERNRATEVLYQRHSAWVIREISRKIYNPHDVQDIAQVTWMIVLDVEKLKRDYHKHHGKFRAYLRAPIKWAILKHLDKLPFKLDESGSKSAVWFTDVDEALLDETLSAYRVHQLINDIIKPNLKQIGIRSRNVYMVNDFDVIFDQSPGVNEIASINGIGVAQADQLIKSAADKEVMQCDDHEFSVYVPVNYDSLVDRDQLDKNSGNYLSAMMGISRSAFNKRLHLARKFLIDTVRKNLIPGTGESNYG